MPQVVANLSRLKGLPIRAITPEEGLPYGASGAAMLTKAPHPNAARLFLEFLLSDQEQEAMALQGYGSVTDFVSKKVPPELSKLTGAPMLGTANAEDADKMLKLATDIYR
jgi:iron(III) transport system substrate-binding protein